MCLNGSQFLSAPTPAFSTVASVAIHFDAGSHREGPHEHGLSHFFEHLPPGGWRGARGEKLAEFAAERNWQVVFEIDYDTLTFGFICPDYDAVEAAHMLRDLASRAPESYGDVFEVERGRIINEIQQRSRDARSQTIRFFGERFFQGSGYDHPIAGSEEDIRRCTFAAVAEQGRRILSNESGVIAVSAPPQIIAAAAEILGAVSFSGCGPRSSSPPLSSCVSWGSIPGALFHQTDLYPNVQVNAVIPPIRRGLITENLGLELLSGVLDGRLHHALSAASGLSYGASFNRLTLGDIDLRFGQTNVAPAAAWKAAAIMKEIYARLPETISEEMVASFRHRKTTNLYLQSSDLLFARQLKEAALGRTVWSMRETLAALDRLTVDGVKEIALRCFEPRNIRFVFEGADRVPGAV